MKRVVSLFAVVCLLAMQFGCEDDKRSRRSKSSRSDDASELDDPRSRNRVLASAVDFDELEERDDSGEWDDSDIYWESGNYTANGAGTSATSLILTSVDGLYIGMQLSHVNSVFQTEERSTRPCLLAYP